MASKNPADDQFNQDGPTPINAAKVAYWTASDCAEVFGQKHREDLARFKARVDSWREAATKATGTAPSLDEALAANIDIPLLTKAIEDGSRTGNFRDLIDLVIDGGPKS